MARTLFLGLLLTGSCLAQPLTPEAYVQLKSLSQGSLSEDGQVLAYTVHSQSPRRETTVCLFEDGQARPILEGAFQPGWSPDGQALALLERDENEARLKVWWRKTGTWAVLHHASLGADGGPGYAWLDSQRLLVATRVETPDKSDVRVLDTQNVRLSPRYNLVEWNPDTGNNREWAEGVFGALIPSPDGQKVAALRVGQLTYPATARPLPPQQLVVLNGSENSRTIDCVANPKADSLRWSGDGKQLLACDENGHWWQIQSSNGDATQLPKEISDCCWVGNQLATRSDVWRLDGKAILPASARLFAGGARPLAIADGKLYGVGAEATVLAELPGNGPVEIEHARWPLVVRRDQQRVAINRQGQVRTLSSSGAFFAGVDSRMWLTNPEHTQLVNDEGASGPQLAMPESGDRLQMVRQGKGGADWLLLPEGNRPGPYPTIVWLSPGQVYSDKVAPREAMLSPWGGGLNARLLSARGYAVYFPSLERGHREPGAWVQEVVNNALTQIRANSSLDSNKLGVLGQGPGGYAALLAATQTHPFKAAVAVGAYADPGEDFTQLKNATVRPLTLEQAPWSDPQQMVRNSAYLQSGKVQAPVLLLNGSQDPHLPQAEQFFASLYRQGKAARLVRYQGEAQSVGQADHLVDQWKQIYFWLDEHVGQPASASSGDSKS